MTVRLYTRVSSAAQVDRFSLTAQRQQAEAWAAYQGLAPVKLYEERGLSGRRDDRPQLANLMDELQAGDTVLVYSLSRLGRGGTVQLLSLVRDIEATGARLVSLTENIDTQTPAGRLLLTLLAALTEMEVETTQERVQAGKAQAAAQGFWPSADHNIQMGWRRGDDRRLEIDPETVGTIRLLFELAGQGMSYAKIAQYCNEHGIPSRTGVAWVHQTVIRIIKSPSYYNGEIVYRQSARPGSPADWVSIPVPPIITEAQWLAAQRTRSTASTYRKPELYPLSSFLFCACGAGMHGGRRNRYRGKKVGGVLTDRRAYTCAAKRRGTPRCPVHGLHDAKFDVGDIDSRARAALVDLLGSPEFVAAIMTPATANADPHRREREELERRRSLLIDLHVEGVITREEFERRRRDYSRRINDLMPRVQPVSIDPAALSEYRDAAQHLEGTDYLDLLRELRVQFEVHAGGQVTVKTLSVAQV